jgi:hypothetical protein
VVVATPAITVTGDPIGVVPTSNCTVPDAVGLSVAVKVTEVPNSCGLAGDALREVIVGVSGFTVNVAKPVDGP